MKRRIPYAIAAALAASSLSLAFAQTEKDVNRVDTNANPKAPSAMSDVNVPNTRPDVNSTGSGASGNKANPAPTMAFVKEPVASASTTQGAEAQLVASIVQALNADPALQNSKIAVVPAEGTVVLSGVTLTQAQKKEALQVATSQAGETKVVDAMQSDDA